MAILKTKDTRAFEAFFSATVDFSAEKYDELFAPIADNPSALRQAFHLFFKAKPRKAFIEAFLYRALQQFPKALLLAIRQNEAFLRPRFAEEVLRLPVPSAHDSEKGIWTQLFHKDQRLWGLVETNWSHFSESKSETLLGSITAWIENRRYSNYSNAHLHDLMLTYNLVVERQFAGIKTLGELSIPQLNKGFRQAITNDSLAFKYFEAVYEWIKFYHLEVLSYCFQETKSGISQLEPTRRKQLNKVIYKYYGEKFVDSSISIGKLKIPTGDSPQDQQHNRHLMELNLASKIFLKDSSLDDIYLDSSNHIASYPVVKTLQAFSLNRLTRYDLPCQIYAKESNIDQYRELLVHLLDSDDSSPVSIFTKSDFIKRVYTMMSVADISTSDIKNYVQKLSIRFPKSFNRFNPKINVGLTPFLTTGDLLFCPTSLLSNNEWFYASFQVVVEGYNIKQRGRKKTPSQIAGRRTALKMEQQLEEEFTNQLKVHCEVPPNQNIPGDIDIMVSDGRDVLYIQLKRTKLRMSSREAYFEMINSTEAAFKQIEDYTSRKTAIGRSPTQWLVSTSYEAIGKRSGVSVKVNYFDVLHALRLKNHDSLEAFIQYIESDQLMKDYGHLLN